MKIACEQLNSISAAVAVVLIPVVVVFIGHGYNQATKERDLQGRFVELAVSILREEPTEATINLRTWATNVIDNYSGIPLTDPVREDLIRKIPIPSFQVEAVPHRWDWQAVSDADGWWQTMEVMLVEARVFGGANHSLDIRLRMTDSLTDFILNSPDEFRQLDELANRAVQAMLYAEVKKRIDTITSIQAEFQALKP